MAKVIKITQTKSIINSLKDKHRPVMRALGFRKHQRTLYKKDTPQIRGMLHRVRHLVVWELVDESEVPNPRKSTTGVTVISSEDTRSRS